MGFKMFAVFHNDAFYYLTCNTNRNAVKHILGENKFHVEIPSSKIPNFHEFHTYVYGIHLGNKFLIFGGLAKKDSNSFENVGGFKSAGQQYKSSLFSLKREKWIQGPVFPPNSLHNTICATAINSSTLIMFGLHKQVSY